MSRSGTRRIWSTTLAIWASPVRSWARPPAVLALVAGPVLRGAGAVPRLMSAGAAGAGEEIVVADAVDDGAGGVAQHHHAVGVDDLRIAQFHHRRGAARRGRAGAGCGRAPPPDRRGPAVNGRAVQCARPPVPRSARGSGRWCRRGRGPASARRRWGTPGRRRRAARPHRRCRMQNAEWNGPPTLSPPGPPKGSVSPRPGASGALSACSVGMLSRPDPGSGGGTSGRCSQEAGRGTVLQIRTLARPNAAGRPAPDIERSIYQHMASAWPAAQGTVAHPTQGGTWIAIHRDKVVSFIDGDTA